MRVVRSTTPTPSALRSAGGDAAGLFPDPLATPAVASTPLLDRCPYFAEVLDQIRCPQTSARLLRLASGSTIREHRDYELAFEDGEIRLHIPVATGPEVEFALDGRPIVMAAGECWYLNLNLPHRVAIPTKNLHRDWGLGRPITKC